MGWASRVVEPPEGEWVRYHRGLPMLLGRRERGGGWRKGVDFRRACRDGWNGGSDILESKRAVGYASFGKRLFSLLSGCSRKTKGSGQDVFRKGFPERF